MIAGGQEYQRFSAISTEISDLPALDGHLNSPKGSAAHETLVRHSIVALQAVSWERVKMFCTLISKLRDQAVGLGGNTPDGDDVTVMPGYHRRAIPARVTCAFGAVSARRSVIFPSYVEELS